MKKHFLVLAILPLCSCQKQIGNWQQINVTTNRIETTIPGYFSTPFNTSMYVSYFIYNEQEKESENILKQVKDIYENEVIRLHKLYDRYYTYKEDDKIINNVKVINDTYGTNTPVKVDKDLFSLIKLGLDYGKMTNGYYNIFTGGLTDFWNEIFDSESLVKDVDPYYNMSNADKLSDIVKSIPTVDKFDEVLTLDEQNLTVTFNKYESESVYQPIISLGGIAKGFATDIVKEKLVENNLLNGLLFSGGSSISSLSKPIYTDKKGLEINVVDPTSVSFYLSEPAFSFASCEEFNVSTSGNYTINKSYWFIPEGESDVIYRHHIINPFTGYPMSYHRSVTLYSTTLKAGDIDALSTALVNLNIEDGLKLKKQLFEQFNYEFDIIYLDQEGPNNDAKLSVYATSSINNTLKIKKKGIESNL